MKAEKEVAGAAADLPIGVEHLIADLGHTPGHVIPRKEECLDRIQDLQCLLEEDTLETETILMQTGA